jgi:phage terminase large subunit-like protein
VIFDEVIAQPDGQLWDALRTAMGARTQPLMVALTTAGNDPSGFAAAMHTEMTKIDGDPARAAHVFVFMRNLPVDADPWTEANWYAPNPALGDFLSVEALRQEAEEAQKNPRQENSFRQFRLNQWVQQTTRWLPLHEWDACIGEVLPDPEWIVPRLTGRRCFGGLDLAAKVDLTALTWWFPATEILPGWAIWRFWIPEAALAQIDRATGGQARVWARDGWITVTPGDVVDYETIYADITEDAGRFAVAGFAYDEWSGEPVRQEIESRTGLELHPVKGTFIRMTPPMKEFERLVRAREINHGGNPVARFCVDNIEVRRNRHDPEQIAPQRPDRQQSGKRIDGAVSLTLALEASLTGTAAEPPAYSYVEL